MLTGVVRLEADDKVTHGSSHECVSSHGDSRESGCIGGVPVTGIVLASLENLEIVTVKMEPDRC